MVSDRPAILAMLGDRPYWFSALEVLGAPCGVSFPRTFNYRPQWVDDDLLGNLQDGGPAFETDAVIGLRFRDEDGSGSSTRFIPVRMATATFTRDGEISIHFVFGQYVDIDSARVSLVTSTDSIHRSATGPTQPASRSWPH